MYRRSRGCIDREAHKIAQRGHGKGGEEKVGDPSKA